MHGNLQSRSALLFAHQSGLEIATATDPENIANVA